MLNHLFKLIWNRKRKHFLLMTEILVSFLVLFTICSLVLHNYGNYSKPQGFDHQNVWALYFVKQELQEQPFSHFADQINTRIAGFNEIEAASFCGENNVPFSFGQNIRTLKYENLKFKSGFHEVDKEYAKAMSIKLKQGRWFDQRDAAAKYPGIVINESLRKKLFGSEDGIGKVITSGEEQLQVVGLIDSYKYQGDFQGPAPSYFQDINITSDVATLLVKVKNGVGKPFEAKLFTEVSNIAKGYQVSIEPIEQNRQARSQTVLIPIIILIIVCGFLIFNVILGLFGILWNNISSRTGEIGLRRALGATQNLVARQFILEIVVIATFSLILGAVFAIQFPIMNVMDVSSDVYFMAILLSTLLIYLIVVSCAIYPSWLASKIPAAIALHEE